MLRIKKNLLIISSWAPPKIGGAQNLYNIFSNINPDNYKILTSEQNFSKPINKVGSTLQCKYFFYRGKTNNIIVDPNLPKNKYYYKIKKHKKIFILVKNISTAIKFIIDIFIFKKIINTSKFIIKQEKINILMGLSDLQMNLFYTYIISKLTKLSFTLYLFDLYKGNLLSFPYNMIAKIMEPAIFKSATHIFVTNDETKKYYVKKYGEEEKYSIIHNSVSPDAYMENNSLKEMRTEERRIKIVFTGNIYWPQEQSLKNLLHLIKNTNNNITLTIYCPNVPKNILDEYGQNKNINFTNAQQSEMPKIQSDADILFLPLSWNTDAPDIIKTASPGKLTDYLIAGKPILIHAPDYSFVAKYAKENKFAEVVDENSTNMLEKAILKIISDKNYSTNLVENAKKTFYKNHNATDNARKLVNIINNI